MVKRFGLFIAVILVIVQTYTVWHMAEHAFHKHSHNGKLCDIAFAFEKVKALNNTAKPQLSQITFLIIRNIPFNDFEAKTALYSTLYPRAPPFIS